MHHDEVGRVMAEDIRRHPPGREADFYRCGPLGFRAAVEGALDGPGTPIERHHGEAFAPDPSFAAGAPAAAPQARAP